jgi:HSP20 family protein
MLPGVARKGKETIMAILSRWDPFGEMQRLTDQVLRGWTGEAQVRSFAPAVDIFEDEASIVVKAELPGVKPGDVHIDVENNVLTLSGERKLEREEKREGYHRIESVYGNFTRSFALPEAVDADKVEADMSEGILSVRIPKKPETAHKRIEVRARAGEGQPQGVKTVQAGEQSKQEGPAPAQPEPSQTQKT